MINTDERKERISLMPHKRTVSRIPQVFGQRDETESRLTLTCHASQLADKKVLFKT